MTVKDRTAIAGVGATPYYRRGESYPRSVLELTCKAISPQSTEHGPSS